MNVTGCKNSAEKVRVRACVLTFLGRNIGWSVIKDTIEEKTLCAKIYKKIYYYIIIYYNIRAFFRKLEERNFVFRKIEDGNKKKIGSLYFFV